MTVQWVKLAEVVDVKGGKRLPAGAEFASEPTAHPYIRGQDIRNGRIRAAEQFYITEAVFEKLRRYTVRGGDVCITIVGNIGDVGVTPPELDGANLTENAVKLIPTTSMLDSRFLAYALLSPAAQQQMKLSAAGAAQPKLGIYKVNDIEIPFPAVDTQRRIASILSAYDDLIENNTRRIAILEEMARRIYEEWFVRFRFPGHEGVRMVESELGLIPEEWKVKALQDIASITMGLSPKGNTYNENSDGIPLINGPVEFGERFTKRVKWTTAPTKLCGEGDLVVCVRGSTGKYVKSDGVYCLGRGVCAIRGEHQGFIDQVFAHHLPTLLRQAGGSTFPSWTGPQLKLYPVLVPTRDLLARFEMHAKPMRDAVCAYSRQSDNLRTTRDLLLPKLISGELDVSALPEPEARAA